MGMRLTENLGPDYAAGYMWGVTGMIYNPDEVTQEEASTWSILTNEKFHRRVTIKDNVKGRLFPDAGNPEYRHLNE